MNAMLVLGQQGRLVIPAEVSELRGLASKVPNARSLVDELIKERRHAASHGE